MGITEARLPSSQFCETPRVPGEPRHEMILAPNLVEAAISG